MHRCLLFVFYLCLSLCHCLCLCLCVFVFDFVFALHELRCCQFVLVVPFIDPSLCLEAGHKTLAVVKGGGGGGGEGGGGRGGAGCTEGGKDSDRSSVL